MSILPEDPPPPDPSKEPIYLNTVFWQIHLIQEQLRKQREAKKK